MSEPINSSLNQTSSAVIKPKGASQSEGAEYPLLGSSPAMSRVRKQIEFASKVNFPIFISGESGTEKRSVAYHVHQSRYGNSSNLVYVPANIHNLAGYKHQLARGIEQAKGGTLYLSEIDNLTTEQRDHLVSLFTLDDLQNVLNKQQTALIISCIDSSLKKNACAEFLTKLLGNSLPHLEINIPALRQRKDDIIHHVRHITHVLSFISDSRFSPGAMALLTDFDWPGNISQLQDSLTVLVSCYPDGEITESDIFSLNLIKQKPAFPDVVEAIGRKDFGHFMHIHPALLKALIYIGDHFTEDVTLSDLSNAAFASSSHLSFLFREYLGRSFKTILVEVRVRYAQQCITNSPMMQITDICLRSGFGDLSHFEKMFKRHVGCNPRQYRQNQREENLVH